jgi:cell volume regulation protein A
LPAEIKKSSVFEKELTLRGRSVMIQTTISSECPCIGKTMLDLSLNGVTIASIERDGRFITPEGSTAIQKNDRLLILADNQAALNDFYNLFGLERNTETAPS